MSSLVVMVDQEGKKCHFRLKAICDLKRIIEESV